MNRSKTLFFLSLLLFIAFTCSSCSGPKTRVICTVNCGGGGPANLSFTMVADTLPATPSILSFQVVVLGVTVTSSTSTKTLSPPSAPIDLMRLQSDSALLGTLTNVPSETISSLSVALSSQKMTILNNTGVALTSPPCPVNAICTFNPNAVSSVLIDKVNRTFSSNAGFGLDINVANAISITGTTLNVNFSPVANNVFTEFTLPRTGSTLASTQFDLIEDVTGVVTVSGQNATIKNPLTNATLTAAATSSTNFDTDPTTTLCPITTKQTLATCVSNNQIASMDVIVNSDGTTSIQEIEPLLATQQDFVEGIVVGVTQGSTAQFTLIVTDMLPAASNSLIGGGLLSDGDGLTVNLKNANNFLIDTKGLNLSSFTGNTSTFTGANNTGALHLGQRVAVHVTGFTGPSASTLASVNSDTVTLRWSRFAASVSSPGTPAFNITGFPPYFNISGIAQVQGFTGTPGAGGVTNLDGLSSTASLNPANPVYLRALYIENPGLSLAPAFYAAKIRQH
jgi:hypothetical protein